MSTRKQDRAIHAARSIKDGFYIEVRNRSAVGQGIRLHSLTEEAMIENGTRYLRSNKHVIILGEYRNKKWLSKPTELTAPEKVEG